MSSIGPLVREISKFEVFFFLFLLSVPVPDAKELPQKPPVLGTESSRTRYESQPYLVRYIPYHRTNFCRNLPVVPPYSYLVRPYPYLVRPKPVPKTWYGTVVRFFGTGKPYQVRPYRTVPCKNTAGHKSAWDRSISPIHR